MEMRPSKFSPGDVIVGYHGRVYIVRETCQDEKGARSYKLSSDGRGEELHDADEIEREYEKSVPYTAPRNGDGHRETERRM